MRTVGEGVGILARRERVLNSWVLPSRVLNRVLRKRLVPK
jgi:hypothetical protein